MRFPLVETTTASPYPGSCVMGMTAEDPAEGFESVQAVSHGRHRDGGSEVEEPYYLYDKDY